MELRETVPIAVKETLAMFNLSAQDAGEMEQGSLTSANQVNVLIGLTEGLRGNLMIGLSRSLAMTIASGMMGGMEVKEMDVMARSAIGELGNLVSASAVLKMESEETIQISPPTVAIGDRMFLMISRAPSTVIQFQVGSERLAIRFALE